MRDYLKFYINGAWVNPITANTLVVINPATEAVAGRTRWARPPTSTRR